MTQGPWTLVLKAPLCLLACPLPSQPLLASRAEESRVQLATLGRLAGWGVERGYSEEWATVAGVLFGVRPLSP